MTPVDVVILILTVLILGYYLLTRTPKNFPPGPKPWPIIGNMDVIKPGIHRWKQFNSLGKIYGDIVGLHFASLPVIVLNNPTHIKEAFAQSSFSGRVISNTLKDRNFGGHGKRGIIFSEGPSWMEQRRFCIKTLKDFGFGKKSMENTIMEEVNELINSFKAENGEPFTTQNRFNIAVVNALWTILAGERFDHDDPRLQKMIRGFTTALTKRPLISFLAEFFPFFHYLRKALPIFFSNPGRDFNLEVYGMVQETIDRHESTLQEDSPRDIIDAYLNRIRQTKEPESSFRGVEGLLGLKVTLLDLFAAGAETTSSTLAWAFLILALHPEVQEKLHEEIKQVVGLTRHVTFADRSNLPYLEATILEVLRYSALASTGVPHKVTEDVNFHGFTFPEGSLIIPNLYNAMRSKEAWGDPDSFRPERFINSEGKCVLRNEAFMPFSTGKRICLGETLAKDELFLFMGNVFQRLKVTTYDGEPKPTLEPNPRSTQLLSPKDHKIVVLDRERF